MQSQTSPGKKLFMNLIRDKNKTLSQQVAGLRTECDTCITIFRIFQSAVVMIDEVDMILHPLKSELHWPIGNKVPLDFTSSPNPGDQGLRWRLPLHLLDAVFYCTGNVGPAVTSLQVHPPTCAGPCLVFVLYSICVHEMIHFK